MPDNSQNEKDAVKYFFKFYITEIHNISADDLTSA